VSGSAEQKYVVTETNGEVHELSAEFLFNNDGELILRSGPRGQTEIIGMFAKGQWSSCVKVKKSG